MQRPRGRAVGCGRVNLKPAPDRIFEIFVVFRFRCAGFGRPDLRALSCELFPVGDKTVEGDQHDIARVLKTRIDGVGDRAAT